jgi:hypothetical protein
MSLKAALSLILPSLLLFCGTAHGQSAATSENSNFGGPVATGGGLFPVKDGRPVSFSEAGYVFHEVESKVLNREYQTYYKITPETKKALRQVLSEVPPVFDLESTFDKIVGDRTAFIWQTKVDAKVLAEIQTVYSAVIASFGQELDPSSAVLVAYSRENKTYILPPFTDVNAEQPSVHLNDEQRALNLIHEFKMRGNDLNQSMQEAQARLKRALQLDELIHNYRHGRKTAMDQLEFARAFGKLAPELADWNAVNRVKNSAIARLIGDVEKQIGRPLLLSEIVGKAREVQWTSDRFYADPNLIRDFESVLPNISKVLPNFSLHAVGTKLIGEDIELDFGPILRFPRAALSSKMQTQDQRAKNSERAWKVMNKLCEKHQSLFAASDVKGERLMHYDEQFDRVLLSDCKNTSAFLWAE